MSKTIEERVVSFQFDNRNFEKNVSTSMSTLEKLKQKLSFKGATKGFENISAAASKVNMNGLSKSIDTIQAKFSALDVVAITALSNITNHAMQAGKNMIKALTIDPVMDGFREYETQINAVQTILANTKHKGTTLDQVNKALDELNEYADKTIYNFTEMTNNIGKFTAAGVDLDKSVSSIKGIANLAAVSGSTAQQTSMAMYQLSQALASGTVRLQDWISVENASMGGKVFQDALKRTAEHFGSDVDSMIEKYGTFRASLTEGGWLTTEVLTETLTQLSGAYSEADLIAQGYSKKQAKEIVELAKTAEGAATDVKTFTQLIDTMKEAVGSGWAQTWKLIFGDFEEAKKFWTGISDFFTGEKGIVTRLSNARNAMVEGALGSKWSKFEEKINKAGISTKEFQKALTTTAKAGDKDLNALIKKYGSLEEAIAKGGISTKMVNDAIQSFAKSTKTASKDTEDLNAKLKKFQKVVDEVWRGDYKNVDTGRIELLKKAGYEYKEVQDLVNKTVGGRKLTLEDLSKEQLKSVGYTDKEIKALQELAKEAERSGTSMNKLIEQITRPTGRELLFETLANTAQPFIKILGAIHEGWNNAFPPEQRAEVIYDIIAGLNEFSKHLVITDETANKLGRTFKGLFAIIDMLSMVLGGGLRIGLTIVSKTLIALLDALGFSATNILDVTAIIGDYLVKIRDWIENNSILNTVIEVTVNIIVKLFKAVYNLINALWKLPAVQSAIGKFYESMRKLGKLIDSFFGPIGDSISEFVNSLSSLENITFDDIAKSFDKLYKSITKYFSNSETLEIGKNIIDGISKGISDGANAAWTAIINIGKGLIDKICEVLGIHSPSVEFMKIGQYAIEGLCLGIKNGLGAVAKGIESIADVMIDTFRSINFGDVFIFGSMAASVMMFFKISKILDKIATPFEGFGKVLDGVGNILNSVSANIDQRTKNLKSEYILNLAKAIGILSASLVALSLVDPLKLWNAVAVVTALGAGMLVLTKVLSKMSGPAGKFEFAKISLMMIGMGTALLIISSAVKKIAGIEDPMKAVGSIVAIGVLIAAMGGLMVVYGKFVKGKAANNIAKAGKMLLLMSVSISILSSVIKKISGLSEEEVKKGLKTMYSIGTLFATLIAVSLFAGKRADKAGAMILKMSVAIGALVLVMKLIATMSIMDIGKGLVVIKVMQVIFKEIIKISKNAGEYVSKAGSTLLKMSVAISILVLTMKLIGTMSIGDIVKGLAVIKVIQVIFKEIIKISKDAGGEANTAGSMLLKMSAAIGILALTMRILSGMSSGDILKGLFVITITGFIFKELAAISSKSGEYASRAGSMFMKMSIAIGILAVAIKVLAGVSVGDLLKGVMTIGSLMLFMTGMLKVSQFAGEFADKAGTMFLKMSAAIVILVGAIAILSLLDPKKVAIGTACISALIGMFTLFTAISSLVKGSKGVIGPIIALGGVVTLLSGIIWMLSGLPVSSVIGTSTALSMLILSLSTSMVILSMSKSVTPNALLAMAGLTAIVGGLGSILYLLQGMDPVSTLSTATALSELLLAMSASMAILTLVGLGGPAALYGLGALAALILGLGGLLAAFGALQKYVVDLEGLLNTGIPILEKIGWALGSFFGSIIEGFADSVLNIIPNIGTKLSEFMNNAQPFFDGLKGVDPNAANAAKSLGQTILYLTGSSILDGIARFFGISGDMASFGEKLTSFGKSMVAFSQTVSGKIDENAIIAAANAGKTMAEMQKTLPGTGGVVQWFMGEKDMGLFSTQLVAFGKAIVGFSKVVSAEGAINAEAITSAANAGKIMSEFQSTLPNTGGVVAWFTGDKDMSKFGESIVSFGKSITAFSNTVKGNVDETAVQAAANAGSIMAKLQEKLPKDKAWWDIFSSGNISLEDFAADLIPFGEKMASFAEKVKDVTVEQVTGITDSAWKLLDLVKTMDSYELTGKGAKGFTTAINALANANISGFVEAFSGQIETVSSIGKSLVTAIQSGIESKSTSMKSSAAKVASNMVSGFESKKESFKSSGSSLMNKFDDGIDSKKSSATRTLSNILTSCSRKINGYYEDFKSCGKYLVQGFANGISVNTYLATAKAQYMASQAEEAARKELDINSPSKIFRKIGSAVPEGFAQGISMFGSAVNEAVSGMGSLAIKGTEKAISLISSVVDSDIDVQPRIRPVVDLSDVRAGAGTINGMFNLSPSIGVMSRVNGLSNSMNKIQNRDNDDVVSAIRDLKRSMNNIGGDTYNVNGITYDDGSNVTDAVQTIIRAARIERRK